MAIESALAKARDGDGQAFGELTDPYRRELQLHCYRILGSVQDAEDMVQETMLAAWRGLGGFEERASVRSWLYRIATNRCLNALRDSGRRSSRPSDPQPPWLEPYPDALLADVPDAQPGPETRYETREALSLAFTAGLQRLPPRQRAVLVLRDVLGFRAAEVSALIDSTEASVNSALQRARAALGTEARDPDRTPLPRSARERELVGQFVDALEAGDIDRVVALLTGDARLTMPPEPLEFQGPGPIADFFRARGWNRPRYRLVPTRANGQPAFGYYVPDAACPVHHANGLLVLTLRDDGISAITRFGDSSLFPLLGLPRTLRN